jgi:hypothetical protein
MGKSKVEEALEALEEAMRLELTNSRRVACAYTKLDELRMWLGYSDRESRDQFAKDMANAGLEPLPPSGGRFA